MTTDLVRYDAMVRAIAECHDFDEVAEIQNKALALEMYAQQSRNVEAERKACEIRLRAERKAGDLLATMQRASKPNPAGKNGHEVTSNRATQPRSEYASALERTGISKQTAHRYQQLARVPEPVFEAAMRDPVKPTTTSLIKAKNGAKKMDDNALWLWGRLRDFEQKNLAEHSFGELFDGMTETMQADVRRIVPVLTEWLSQIEEVA